MKKGLMVLICVLACRGTLAATVVWDGVNRASASGEAMSIPYGQEPYTDSESRAYPGDPLPLHVDVYAHVYDGGYASGTADVANSQVRLRGSAGMPSAWIGMWGSVSDSFQVVGGTGPVQVDIPVHLTGFVRGDRASGNWSAGVAGIGEISGNNWGHGYDPIDEEHVWSGILTCGTWYVFVMSSHIEGSDADTDADMLYVLDLAGPAAVETGGPEAGPELRIFPNPVGTSAVHFIAAGLRDDVFHIRLFDPCGRLVCQSPPLACSGGRLSWVWEAGRRAPAGAGTYFAELRGGRDGELCTRKLVIVR